MVTPSVSLRSTASRAVEPALGQGMPRTMGHSQVRRRQRAHRGFAKKALAHPQEGAKGITVSQIMAQAGVPCARALNLYPQGIHACLHLNLAKRFLRSKKIFAKSNSLSQAGFPCASSQRSKFRKPLRSSRLCSDARSSRAVEPALGQGMPRTMGHSQVRKWSKPHRGFAKKALAHPLPKKLAIRLFWEPFS